MSETSNPIGRIAVDSNGLLSAICGHAASKVFAIAPAIEVITTEANIAEVEEYLPEMAERYGLDLGVLELALAALPVRVYSETDYLPISARHANTWASAIPMTLTWQR